MNTTELDLINSIAKSEGLNKGCEKPIYNPLYKHPLPISEHRYDHEHNLRRILSAKKCFQGMAAITKGDAWVLEEIYLQHGRECLADKDGVSPLHIAVQLNQFECVQVLLHIGVDVNQLNQYGLTPLRVAKINGFGDIEELLLQYEAKEIVDISDEAPVGSVLDVYPEQNHGRFRSSVYQSKNTSQVSRAAKYF